MLKKLSVLLILITILSVSIFALTKYKVDPLSCIGCTLCIQKCPVQAIEMVEGKAIIDPEKCIGCGICAKVCPVKAIDEYKFEKEDKIKKLLEETKEENKEIQENKKLNKDKKIEIKENKKLEQDEKIEIKENKKSKKDIVKAIFINASNCVGCNACVEVCPVQALTLENGKAIIDYEKCIKCYQCVPVCNYDAIKKNKD